MLPTSQKVINKYTLTSLKQFTKLFKANIDIIVKVYAFLHMNGKGNGLGAKILKQVNWSYYILGMIFGEKYDEAMKFILIGDSGVGKTSFLNRFCYGTFKKQVQCTVGLECGQKIVNQAGRRALVQLWDTAGQERFRNITPSFYRSAMAVILMYSADSRESFNSVAVWMKQISAFAAEDVPVLIVCNKADIIKKQVSEKESRALAEAYGLPLMIVSCLSDINVEETISELCKLVKRKPANNRKLKRLKESSKSIQSCYC